METVSTIFRTCLLILLFACTLHSQWVQTDWAYNGSASSFAVSGTDIFAAISGSGVYRSTNDGENWVRTGLANIDVKAFAVSGTNVFAGGNGIFRTSDGGTSWTKSDSGLSSRVTCFAASGTDLFAGTSGGGVLRSTNNGTSWTPTTLTTRVINALAVVPADSGITLFAGNYGAGVYRSSDNGASWIAVNTGLTNKFVNVLAVSPADSGTGGMNLFAGTYLGGVFRSTDNGTNWAEVNTGLTYKEILAFVISGKNIFAGTDGGVFRSADNGTTWIQTSPINAKVYCLNVSTAGNVTNLFAGPVGLGVIRSTDNGASWIVVNQGLTNISIDVLAVFSGGGGTNLFAGTGNNGIFRSNNNGTTWTQSGLVNTNVRALAVSGSNIFAGTNTAIFYSNDNGTNWSSVYSTGSYPITSFAVSATNVFAGTEHGGVLISTYIFCCWKYTPLPITYHYDYDSVYLACIGNNLFAASKNGMFLSTNNGTNWTAVNNGLTTYNFNALVVSGTNLFAGTDTGVFLSTNLGANWSHVGLASARVFAFVDYNTNLFAGTDSGVFLSTNNGTNWTQIGLTDRNVNSLAVSGLNLFAATGEEKLWLRPLSDMFGPLILVLKPNGGEQYYAGASDTIRWQAAGSSNVKIDYSSNAGYTWSTITSSTSASAGVYPWLVSNTSTTQGLIRISDADSITHSDISNSYFTIRKPPSITISPDSFDISFYGEYFITSQVRIQNTGGENLVWNISWDSVVFPGVISVSLKSGVNSPGLEKYITLTVDLNSLPAGNHTIDLKIISNDPLRPTVHIPIHVQGEMGPRLGVSTNFLVFRNAFIGFPDTMFLILNNTGRDVLVVSKLTLGTGSFRFLSDTSFAIAVQGQRSIPIVFDPVSEGLRLGTLTIYSNDKRDSIHRANVSGNAFLPPLFSMSSDSILLALHDRDTTTVSFTIRNAGPGILHYYFSPQRNRRYIAIPLVVRDRIGNRDTLTFGVHPLATDCVDLSLGEDYLPPIPSSPAFDARFVGLSGVSSCLDQGVTIDLRPYINDTQIDTYAVAFKAEGTAYTVTLEWPNDLSTYGGSMNMIDFLGGTYVHADMFTTTSLSVSTSSIRKLLIIKSGIPSQSWYTIASVGEGTLTSGDSTIARILIHPGQVQPGRYILYFTIGSDDPLHPFHVLPVYIDLLSGVDNSMKTLPVKFELYQNYPNPFNPTTTIHFDLPRESNVVLKLYDVLGREVRTLLNEKRTAGSYDVTVDGSGLPSGLYFYRLHGDNYSASKKLLLLK